MLGHPDISDWQFAKMHGLGNDFLVFDARVGTIPALNPELVRALGDRHRGVGFDQMAVVGPDDQADLRLTFYNPDGSVAGACGNATRCVAQAEMEVRGVDRLTLHTDRGILTAQDAGGGMTSVNMGLPLTDWRDIPLAQELDTLHLPISGDPVATGMGNPHCTFFVEDVAKVDLSEFGPAHETHPLFPERTNVQIAQVIGTNHLRMRVWERGTGITLASGSSSCAVAVAAARRHIADRSVTIDLDGGRIAVDWRDDGVWMTGPTMHVFTGRLTRAFLESL